MINKIPILQTQDSFFTENLTSDEKLAWEKFNEELDEVLEETERKRAPTIKTMGAYETLYEGIERSERYDENWEEFLRFQYWKGWREQLQNFKKVGELRFYCLRLSEILLYKDKLSNYGSIRNKRVFEKVEKFAWRLINIKKDDFYKEFGYSRSEEVEDCLINITFDSDGDFCAGEFPNDKVFNDLKSDNDSSKITELEEDEEIVRNNNNLPSINQQNQSNYQYLNRENLTDSKKKMINMSQREENEDDNIKEEYEDNWEKIRILFLKVIFYLKYHFNK